MLTHENFRPIRLTKYVVAGLAGAQREGIRKLTGIDPEPRKPEYVYLNPINPVPKAEQFVADDLITMKPRGFKWRRTERWVEFNPDDPHRVMDMWGWFELRLLTLEEVREVMTKREDELKQRAQEAEAAQRNYLLFKAKMIEMVYSNHLREPA